VNPEELCPIHCSDDCSIKYCHFGIDTGPTFGSSYRERPSPTSEEWFAMLVEYDQVVLYLMSVINLDRKEQTPDHEKPSWSRLRIVSWSDAYAG
jgi:hypothetical protein